MLGCFKSDCRFSLNYNKKNRITNFATKVFSFREEKNFLFQSFVVSSISQKFVKEKKLYDIL